MSTHLQARTVSSHVGVIDMIRGLAALSVAFYHTREILWVGIREFVGQDPQLSLASALSFLTFPFVWGSVGVPIFFVLSGYVIHRRSALDLVSGGGGGTFQPRAFLLRRFVRIYPTFFAALLLTFLCDAASRQFAPLNDKLGDGSLAAFAWNVVALQGLFSASYGSNGALWTLALEIQFYAFYPFALLLRRWIGSEWMLLATLVVSVLGAVTLELHGLQAFPAYYFSWWLGAYVADREAEGRPLVPRWPIWATGFTALGCALVLLRHNAYGAHMAWALGFAFLLARILPGEQTAHSSPTRRAFSVVGNFSYSLYAVHVPLVVLISSVLFNGIRQQSIYVPILAFGVVVAAAFVFHLAVERPSIRWLERLSRLD